MLSTNSSWFKSFINAEATGAQRWATAVNLDYRLQWDLAQPVFGHGLQHLARIEWVVGAHFNACVAARLLVPRLPVHRLAVAVAIHGFMTTRASLKLLFSVRNAMAIEASHNCFCGKACTNVVKYRSSWSICCTIIWCIPNYTTIYAKQPTFIGYSISYSCTIEETYNTCFSYYSVALSSSFWLRHAPRRVHCDDERFVHTPTASWDRRQKHVIYCVIVWDTDDCAANTATTSTVL